MTNDQTAQGLRVQILDSYGLSSMILPLPKHGALVKLLPTLCLSFIIGIMEIIRRQLRIWFCKVKFSEHCLAHSKCTINLCFYYYCYHDDFIQFTTFSHSKVLLTNMPRAQIVTLLPLFHPSLFQTSFLTTLYITFDMKHMKNIQAS